MRFLSSLSKSVALLVSVVMLVISSLVFSSPAEATSYQVTMGAGGLKFSPDKVNLQPGDTVTFKNGILAPHNVVFDPKKSPDKKLAKKLSHKKMARKKGETFDINIPANAKSGKYTFFCLPHRGAGMVGQLIVE